MHKQLYAKVDCSSKAFIFEGSCQNDSGSVVSLVCVGGFHSKYIIHWPGLMRGWQFALPS